MGKFPPSLRGARFPVTTLMKTPQPPSSSSSNSLSPLYHQEQLQEQPQKSSPLCHFRYKKPQKKPQSKTLTPTQINFTPPPSPSAAKTLFDSFSETRKILLDNKSCNSILQSFANFSNLDDSIAFLNYMTKTHVSFSPDRSSYPILLANCCKSPEFSVSELDKTLKLMSSNGFVPDKVTSDVAVRSLWAAGHEEQAIEVRGDLWNASLWAIACFQNFGDRISQVSCSTTNKQNHGSYLYIPVGSLALPHKS